MKHIPAFKSDDILAFIGGGIFGCIFAVVVFFSL